MRKQGQVQLRCDAFGDEPITIEWFKNKQRLSNEVEPRYSIHNKPLQNGLISLLVIKQAQRQDNSVFECLTRNQAGKDRLQIELLVQEEPDNIQELQATQINSRSVTLMWTEPYDGRSPITNYTFQYKRVAQEPANLGELDFLELGGGPSMEQLGSKQVAGAMDDWQQASRIMLPVQAQNNSAAGQQQAVKSITIERLEPASKYVLRALAINAIGQSKFSQPMEFSTEEEAPESGPTNIRAVALNSTSIQVSWDELPRSKQPGRIHGYYIGYRLASANNSAASQNFVYKPYVISDLLLQSQQQQQQQQQLDQHSAAAASPVQRLETVVHDLRRDTNYEITVVAFNSRGSGPSSDFALCKTIEMEAPKPVRLQIRRESNESIFIEWQRDPLDQNPVDDYVLYQEKNSASQEWLQVRLPGNQSQYKAPGLKCGTRYQFYIIAHNKVGKSAPSDVVSASTSGALPVIPTKMSLLKMVNSTCLLVNLNSFQDNGCRIRTFTIRYRVERSSAPPNVSAAGSLVGSNGQAATHQALSAAAAAAAGKALGVDASLAGAAPGGQLATSDWITIRPKSNAKHQRANEEDRMEYLCNLNPVGEYTIHVAGLNDVGRSEVEYSVLMSSDELRHSALKELAELLANLPNLFAYIPSLIVFLLAGLFLSLVSLILYTTIIKYYQKFIIMHNQVRATRRAKQDARRRRKLNESRHSQKLDLWADEYEEEEDDDDDDGEEDEDGDDEEDDDDQTSAGSSRGSNQAIHHQFSNPANSHYISNIANSAFDNLSVGGPCNKFTGAGSSCLSSGSAESIRGRFHCLNSKQCVKMNEYTMLPSISASQSPSNDIYGTTNSVNNQRNSLYHSTLRRSNMQTYLPQQRKQQSPVAQQQQQQPQMLHQAQAQLQLNQQQQQQQQQQHRRRSQNVSDIYGYYMAPQALANQAVSSQAQLAANEAANSIFVPPQQIVYSAPNIRRLPVFL